jgi:hypothetical protein
MVTASRQHLVGALRDDAITLVQAGEISTDPGFTVPTVTSTRAVWNWALMRKTKRRSPWAIAPIPELRGPDAPRR